MTMVLPLLDFWNNHQFLHCTCICSTNKLGLETRIRVNWDLCYCSQSIVNSQTAQIGVVNSQVAPKYGQRSGPSAEQTQITVLQFALNQKRLQQYNVGGVTHVHRATVCDSKYYLRSWSERGARNAFGESLIGFSVVRRITATCIPLTVFLWTFQLYFHYIEKWLVMYDGKLTTLHNDRNAGGRRAKSPWEEGWPTWHNPSLIMTPQSPWCAIAVMFWKGEGEAQCPSRETDENPSQTILLCHPSTGVCHSWRWWNRSSIWGDKFGLLMLHQKVHVQVVSPLMVLIPLYVRHVMHTFTDNHQAYSASTLYNRSKHWIILTMTSSEPRKVELDTNSVQMKA